MRKTKAAFLALSAAMLCVALSGCASSVAENTKTYFTNSGAIMETLFSSGKTQRKPAESGPADVKLATPGDFSVDEEGGYTFAGVDGADYYLLCFCSPDAVNDNDPFLFSSSPIYDDGSASYSGHCSDLFNYAYGDYLVKVFAYPALDSDGFTASAAATDQLVVTGAQDAPVIDYFWNTFESTVELQLTNVDTYTYQAYPDRVDVTFTSLTDGSETVVTMEDISASNFSFTSDALKKGDSYSVSAVSTSESQYVTNPVSETAQVTDSVTFDNINVVTEDYSYSDGVARGMFNYPRVCPNFDLANGGSAGDTVGAFAAYSFETVPAPTTAGSSYSYSVTIRPSGTAVLEGMLELYPDGTMLLYQGGWPPVDPTSMEGGWVDNGDGTATLSYSPNTLKIG